MKKPWQKERHHNSLPEVFSSINVPINAGFGKKF
jgi:manganese transport protein